MKVNFPEKYRDTKPGAMQSKPGDNFGRFFIPSPDKRGRMCVVVSSGYGWEHTSISVLRKKRCPTWEEMCYIKDMFWDSDEAVIQIHPPKSDYVNNHQYCLHLWKPTFAEIPLPPALMVGDKNLTEAEAKAASAALGMSVNQRPGS